MEVEQLSKILSIPFDRLWDFMDRLYDRLKRASSFDEAKKLYELWMWVEERLKEAGIEVKGPWWIFLRKSIQSKSKFIEELKKKCEELPGELRDDLITSLEGEKGLGALFSYVEVKDPRSPEAEYHRNLLS